MSVHIDIDDAQHNKEMEDDGKEDRKKEAKTKMNAYIHRSKLPACNNTQSEREMHTATTPQRNKENKE